MTALTSERTRPPSAAVTGVEIPRFRGEVIAAGAADYDDARAVWNGVVDRRPRLIARCSGVGLSDQVIDVVAQHAYRARSPRSYAAVFHMGGAVARVPRAATAHPGRDVAHNMIIDAAWLPDQDDTVGASETGWTRGFLQALQPHRAGVYVNFLDSDDDTSRVREAYGDDTYLRLAEIKAKYDPDNVFHNNLNIEPSEPGT